MTGSSLTVEGVTKRFGGLTAVNNVSLKAEPGKILSVIGPNGAGKTTFFNLLTGIYAPDTGRILFGDKDITGKKSDAIAALGIGRTFQNIRLFSGMTVLENVLVGHHNQVKTSYAAAIFRGPSFRREEARAESRARDLLRYMRLEHRALELSSNLPYGDQRRLEIARALALEPSLLLLDEPAAGMNPQETEDLKSMILSLKNDLGLTIVLIEHDMAMVMSLSDRITVLEYGSVIADGSPSEVKANPLVVEAYLGKERPMLEIAKLTAGYGPIQAVADLTPESQSREIVSLLGSNGAGKSTTLRSISGLLKQKTGSITFEGVEIHKLPPERIISRGISQVPEGRKIFGRLTVDENLEVGAYLVKDQKIIHQRKEQAFALFPRLAERRHQKGGTLSGGEQQMLAIARALMQAPKLLLLDEPSMGLAPLLVEAIFEIIQRLNREGTTILLVEQNARMALQVAHRAYVLANGRLSMEGLASDLAHDPEVQKAYLGG